MKHIRYCLEAVLLSLIFFLCSAMPVQIASGVFGAVARTIGPILGANRKARRNIERALPGLSGPQVERALKDMWENLGRIFAEYPHLKKIATERTEIVDSNITQELFSEGKGAIFVGAHYGNWEVPTTALALQRNVPLAIGYRAPNNPWADRLLKKIRCLDGRVEAYNKSRAGGRSMIDAVKNGYNLGLLIDQKYREGIEVPFFDIPASTNPFFVQLAQKYDVPVIPVRCDRLGHARFRVTAYDAIPTKGREAVDIIADVHSLFESWIEERPGQWLWLHRRWKD